MFLFLFYLQKMLSQERLYSVAVQCAGSIEQNHTHTRCSMLSTMYKTQTSTRRDLLEMSRFIPTTDVELLR